MPDNIADLNIVTGLAKLGRNSVGDPRNLWNKLTQNTDFNFNNDSIQEDTCQWIEALYNIILMLQSQNVNMQINWYNLFNSDFITTYECCYNSNLKSQDLSSHYIL